MSDREARRRRAAARKKRKRQIMRNRIIAAVVVALIVFLAARGILKAVGAKGNSESDGQSSSQVISSSQDISSSETPVNKGPEKTEFTILVNARHPLTEDYKVETAEIPGTGGKLFDKRVIDKLTRMLEDARQAGCPLYVVSTYRTIEYQKGLYNRKVQEYLNRGYEQAAAEEEAGKWVAVPGTSEHNLGLTADIVSTTWYNNHSDLTEEFEETDHFRWLYEHCAEYGFILRYPKGKESVTGIVYEPWHYRYVGEEAAKYIMENNLTLEEFWEE